MGFDDLTGGSAAGGSSESEYFDLTLDPADLVEGDNYLAVEIHQQSSGSSDLGFDIELNATVPPGDAPTVTVNETTLVRARGRDASGEWSGLVEGLFVVGTPADAGNLIVTEINYHPSDPTPADLLADPTLNDDDFEWLELRNISGGTIDLSGAAFVDGIEFAFPPGTTLAAGEYLVVVENLAAFERRYGVGLPVAGVYSNKLRNDGETVRLVGIGGDDIFHFAFNDVWYRPTDGGGYSLNLIDENSVPGDYGEPASWGISGQLLGTPGTPNGGVFSQTFDGWLFSHYTEAERADPAISGLTADSDRDGIVTLLEYALGFDPKVADPGQLPGGNIIDDDGEQFLALTFRRLENALDLSYRVEVSGELETWTEATAIVGVPVGNGDGTETVTVRDTQPIGSARRFMRLSVERVPAA